MNSSMMHGSTNIKFMEIVATVLGYNVRTDRRPSHGKNWSTWGKSRPRFYSPESSFPWTPLSFVFLKFYMWEFYLKPGVRV